MTSVAVAIQGEAGSFSHAAALQALGPAIRLVPCPSFEELFRAVEQGDAARGAVPIENSLAGSVHENYDLLGAHALHVVAETQVRVRHCLIARPGTERAAIRRVASHPVALAQCRRFFATHPDVVPVPAYDTAGSVRDLMAGRGAADAAIASSLAAPLYRAVGLPQDPEDHAQNYTPFLMGGRGPPSPSPRVNFRHGPRASQPYYHRRSPALPQPRHAPGGGLRRPGFRQAHRRRRQRLLDHHPL